jgi:hypothetical protein
VPSRAKPARAWTFLPPAAAVLAFAPILANGFVNHEDYWLIVDNPHLTSLSAPGLRWMLTSSDYGAWHPLGWLLLALLRAAFGLSPAAHHFAGLLLHAAAAALLFLILRFLLDGKDAAASTAASLWAVHPLQLESVGWAVELPDMLAAALALASVLAYLRRRLPLSCFLFALSLLARWKALFLPAALLVLDVHPLGRLGRGEGAETRAALLEKLPYFLIAAVGAWLTFAAKAAGPGHAFSLGAAFPAGALHYLGKTLIPAGLTLDYVLEGSASKSAAFLALTAAAFALRRRAPAVLSCWVIFLGALAPTLVVSYYGAVYAHDRFFYVPSLALAGLLAAALARPPAGAFPAAAMLGIALTAATWRQCAVWRDSVALWTHVLSVPGAPPYARLSLAYGLMERGRPAEAAQALAEHLELFPGDARAREALESLRAPKR